jgi:hypothetical protein
VVAMGYEHIMPLVRSQHPGDLIRAVIRLASPKASAGKGIIVTVEGGFSMLIRI